MAFAINEAPQFRTEQSGLNGFHFWRVTCVDGDTVSDWKFSGFLTQAQDVGVFSTDGVSYPGTGRCKIEVNDEPVTADGRRCLPGQAWRFSKDAGVGTGGTFRVRVGSFPSGIWGLESDSGFSDPVSNMTNI